MALSNQKQDIILKPEFQINRSSQKLYQLINNNNYFDTNELFFYRM